MEGKIVENKKEGSSLLSRSIPLFYLSHLSYLSIYLVCLRSTTPLWFTDICLQDVGDKHERGLIVEPNFFEDCHCGRALRNRFLLNNFSPFFSHSLNGFNLRFFRTPYAHCGILAYSNLNETRISIMTDKDKKKV